MEAANPLDSKWKQDFKMQAQVRRGVISGKEIVTEHSFSCCLPAVPCDNSPSRDLDNIPRNDYSSRQRTSRLSIVPRESKIEACWLGCFLSRRCLLEQDRIYEMFQWYGEYLCTLNVSLMSTCRQDVVAVHGFSLISSSVPVKGYCHPLLSL